MNVPFAFFDRTVAAGRAGFQAAFARVLDSGRFVLGQEVESFEREFAAFSGTRHCVGVANGLEAIQLLLQAHAVGPGAEVIVAANTYIATWLGVSLAGARPVPVEPDLRTFNLDADRLDAAITPQTRAIFGTHLYGRPGPCAEVDAFARQRSLLVFWDAAQAHGATVEGRPISRFGDGTAFSFYPTKNLGCLGDGGAVVTDRDEVAERIRTLRNYGSRKRYENLALGLNSRLDEVQAAFLRTRLPALAAQNRQRAAVARRYCELLAGAPRLEVPAFTEGHVWHLFVVRHPDRDGLRRHLLERGVQTDIHYPTPPHLQPAYVQLDFHAGDFPIAERIHREVLSLPLHPFLSRDETDYVAATVREFCTSA